MLDNEIIFVICLIMSNIIHARPIHEITETRETPETQIPPADGEALKPSEIQKAVCTVTSGDVRASAEAFTTRELKGVCGSDEMLKAFSVLENKFSQELQNIQKLIQDLHRQLVLSKSLDGYVDESYGKPVTSAGSNNVVTSTEAFKFQAIPIEKKQQKFIEADKDYSTPKLKSLSSRDEIRKTIPVPEKEVSKPKNTFATNKDVKVYTYYWRLENFTQSIKSLKSLSKESAIFSIKGKAFKIKAHFQHLHRDYLYLQLEDYSAAPELNSGNSIILDTGSIFKEITSDNFKYKISILDQNKKPSDLVSQEFDNYETGFLIPNSALIDSPFIKDDTLLIQLFFYL